MMLDFLAGICEMKITQFTNALADNDTRLLARAVSVVNIRAQRPTSNGQAETSRPSQQLAW